jgi:hypothetical protein
MKRLLKMCYLRLPNEKNKDYIWWYNLFAVDNFFEIIPEEYIYITLDMNKISMFISFPKGLQLAYGSGLGQLVQDTVTSNLQQFATAAPLPGYKDK